MCTPVDNADGAAVALSLSALTAAAALEVTAGVKEGDVVLVTAAAGGTGHFAVQLAQLAGARVVAVAGSAAKKQRLQALGIERVINYKEEVRGLAGGLKGEY
jgi:NADPH:quinone reductase-like Zn-dependent oxidoreductase